MSQKHLPQLGESSGRGRKGKCGPGIYQAEMKHEQDITRLGLGYRCPESQGWNESETHKSETSFIFHKFSVFVEGLVRFKTSETGWRMGVVVVVDLLSERIKLKDV